MLRGRRVASNAMMRPSRRTMRIPLSVETYIAIYSRHIPPFCPLWTNSSKCRNQLSRVATWFHFLPTLEFGCRLAVTIIQSGELLPGKGMGQMTYSSSRRREADFFAHIDGQSAYRHCESGGTSESGSYQPTRQRLSAAPFRNGHIAHGRAST